MNSTNLRILADGLTTVDPTHFNMRWFTRNTSTRVSDEALIEHNCNTVACALGHGPIFGILPQPHHVTATGWVDWMSYSADMFGISIDTDEDSLWNYLFSARWAYIAPTAQDAADRIYHVLNGFHPGEEYDDDTNYASWEQPPWPSPLHRDAPPASS